MNFNHKKNIGFHVVTVLGIALCFCAAVLAIKQYIFQGQGSGFFFYSSFIILILASGQLIIKQRQKTRLGRRLYRANGPDRQIGIVSLVIWIIFAIIWAAADITNYTYHRNNGEPTILILAGLVIVTHSIRLAWGSGIYEQGLFLQGNYHSWERLLAYEWRKNNQEIGLHIQQQLFFWKHRSTIILEINPEQKSSIDAFLTLHLAK